MVALDIPALRRRVLAHCLSMAEKDEIYAVWAAADYERRWPEILTGLHARFLTDRSRVKADQQKETA